jgi:hypothetical protein
VLPRSGRRGLDVLLESARAPRWRIRAVGAPFELRGSLKRRGYAGTRASTAWRVRGSSTFPTGRSMPSGASSCGRSTVGTTSTSTRGASMRSTGTPIVADRNRAIELPSAGAAGEVGGLRSNRNSKDSSFQGFALQGLVFKDSVERPNDQIRFFQGFVQGFVGPDGEEGAFRRHRAETGIVVGHLFGWIDDGVGTAARGAV